MGKGDEKLNEGTITDQCGVMILDFRFNDLIHYATNHGLDVCALGTLSMETALNMARNPDYKEVNIIISAITPESGNVAIHYALHCGDGTLLRSVLSGITDVVGAELSVKDDLKMKIISNYLVTQ